MEPIVNLEENIGKTVGRRRPPRDTLTYGLKLQETGSELAKIFGRPRYPRGVFKFHSHEEADAWLLKYQTSPRTTTNPS